MDQSRKSGRRSFINFILGGGALAFLASLAYPVVRYLTPLNESGLGSEPVEAGRIEEYQPNSGKIVRFGNKPALVLRTQEGTFKAFIAVCTHLNCTVQYLPNDKMIWCACHNGKYDLNGLNISGPPPRPLESLTVNIQQDQIYISREA